METEYPADGTYEERSEWVLAHPFLAARDGMDEVIQHLSSESDRREDPRFAIAAGYASGAILAAQKQIAEMKGAPDA